MLSPDDARLAAADPAIPGLALALDEVDLAAWAARRWPDLGVSGGRLRYVRYKPGTNCLAAGTLRTVSGSLWFTVKAYADGVVAPLVKAERWSAARTGRRAPLVDRRRAMVVSAFPYDAKIEGASRFTESSLPRLLRQLGHTASGQRSLDMRILSYRPERRLVARIDLSGRTQLLRAYSTPEFARRAATFQRLMNHPVPGAGALDAIHPALPIVGAPFLAGASLDHHLSCIDRAGVGAVGATLARFHQAPTGGLPVRRRSDEQESLRVLADGLAALVPEAAERTRSAAVQIAEALPPSTGRVCCHGDFGARQVLLAPSGPCLIDLDEMVAADARMDIGAWLADLDYRVVLGDLAADHASWIGEAFLQGYARVAPIPDGIGPTRAAALLALAPLPFRRRLAGWRDLTLAVVGAAERRFDTDKDRPGQAARQAAPSSRSAPRPLDPRLPWLAPALDRKASARELAALPGMAPHVTVESARVLRHKPGRRAIVRYDVTVNGVGRALLGKMHHRGADRRTAAVQHALRTAGFDDHDERGLATPHVCGILPRLGMWVQSHVAGVQSTTLLSSAEAPRVSEQLAEVALAIAVRGPRVDRTHTVNAELEVLADRLLSLSRRRTRWTERLTRVLDACRTLASRLPTSASVPAHRDLYPDQVILAGSRAYVVDLDLYCLAPPALDLGNCLAHIIERGLRDDSQHAHAILAFSARAETGLVKGLRPALGTWTTLALARLIEIADRLPGRADVAEPLLEVVESRLDASVGLPSRASALALSPAPEWEVHP